MRLSALPQTIHALRCDTYNYRYATNMTAHELRKVAVTMSPRYWDNDAGRHRCPSSGTGLNASQHGDIFGSCSGLWISAPVGNLGCYSEPECLHPPGRVGSPGDLLVSRSRLRSCLEKVPPGMARKQGFPHTSILTSARVAEEPRPAILLIAHAGPRRWLAACAARLWHPP